MSCPAKKDAPAGYELEPQIREIYRAEFRAKPVALCFVKTNTLVEVDSTTRLYGFRTFKAKPTSSLWQNLLANHEHSTSIRGSNSKLRLERWDRLGRSKTRCISTLLG